MPKDFDQMTEEERFAEFLKMPDTIGEEEFNLKPIEEQMEIILRRNDVNKNDIQYFSYMVNIAEFMAIEENFLNGLKEIEKRMQDYMRDKRIEKQDLSQVKRMHLMYQEKIKIPNKLSKIFTEVLNEILIKEGFEIAENGTEVILSVLRDKEFGEALTTKKLYKDLGDAHFEFLHLIQFVVICLNKEKIGIPKEFEVAEIYAAYSKITAFWVFTFDNAEVNDPRSPRCLHNWLAKKTIEQTCPLLYDFCASRLLKREYENILDSEINDGYPSISQAYRSKLPVSYYLRKFVRWNNPVPKPAFEFAESFLNSKNEVRNELTDYLSDLECHEKVIPALPNRIK